MSSQINKREREREIETVGREERSSDLWGLERFIDVFCINNVRGERGGGGEREGGRITEEEGERKKRQGKVKAEGAKEKMKGRG